MSPCAWTVTAQNLPEHARNPIHTDVGAQAAGFPNALVAGVTTYAYLTHPIVVAWGLDWLQHGGGEVRFRSPVCEHDVVVCAPRADGDATVVDAVVGDGPPRASLRAWEHAGPPPDLRSGEALRHRHIRLEGEWSDDYGVRAGDDLGLYREHGVVHPAVWPGLANHLVQADLARGSWIHTRSLIRHNGLAAVGATVEVEGVVVQRFHRRGERVVLDVRFTIDGRVVATVEHEAIIDLVAVTT